MKAVLIEEHGDVDVLKIVERPRPEPGAGEVLLSVAAVGLNHLDTWVRRGIPGHRFPLPMTPGCDISGTVAELGPGVDEVELGERVLVAPGLCCGRCEHCASGRDNLCRFYGIIGETCDGGCADYVVIPARNAITIPPSLDFVEAAAFPLAFLTAWHMLVTKCGIRAGDDVLVHGAGSGVGSAAIQIAKMFHARVITTAGSAAKLEAAVALGADLTIDYETQDFVAEVKRITAKRGVDIVFEHVGEKTMPGSLRCLGKGGRVVTCGATTGPRLEADLRPLFFKNQAILGSTMGSRGELVHIVDLVGKGLLRPVVDRTLPMSEVAEAHRVMADREHFGKIVLVNE